MASSDTSVVYNYLGKTGIKVSNICLGGLTFGETPTRLPPRCNLDQSHEILQRFAELGGNFVDTADKYSAGRSEEIIGLWLERQNRDNFVISTKVRTDMGTTENINNVGLSRCHITASIDRSLERLHTDYVDLYQMHIWDSGTPTEETLRTLDDLVRCCKVRYVGASNLTGWQLQTVVAMTEKLGLNPCVTLQQQYSLLSRNSELEAFATCKLQGIGVLPWSPLKGGLLTGKYKRGTTPTEGRLGWVAENRTRASESGPFWDDLDDKTFSIMAKSEEIAQKLGRSPAQVALRWLLQKDVVSSVVVGVTKVSQVEDNMEASGGWALSQEQMKELDEVSAIDIVYPYNMIGKHNKTRRNPFSPGEEVQNMTF